ncbi:hypothetical protein [Streptomyces deccanensis]|uniref:hypothetical protein n=1 Tax=Streptomyces deccanensis TaxID=424188 RepID=UPI001EFB1AB8|nr:hypothetical protein [Streptomyces deccanensis]ULR48816.1 hypothetical protein L3078_05780 [Streptomyces deccanensis]
MSSARVAAFKGQVTARWVDVLCARVLRRGEPAEPTGVIRLRLRLLDRAHPG